MLPAGPFSRVQPATIRVPHPSGIPQIRPAVTRSVTPAIEDLLALPVHRPSEAGGRRNLDCAVAGTRHVDARAGLRVLAYRFGFASILGASAAGLLVRMIDLEGRAPYPQFGRTPGGHDNGTERQPPRRHQSRAALPQLIGSRDQCVPGLLLFPAMTACQRRCCTDGAPETGPRRQHDDENRVRGLPRPRWRRL